MRPRPARPRLLTSHPAGAAPDRAEGEGAPPAEPDGAEGATACIDVRVFVRRKLEAMAAHRSQFAFDPDMPLLGLMQELFGREY